MKIVAIILNVGAIMLGIWLKSEHGNNSAMLLIGFFLVVCPLVNLFVLYNLQSGTGWLALYFKRKSIEEQQKIDAINK